MNIKLVLFIFILANFKSVNGTLPTLELLENRQSNHLYCLLRNETESTAIVWETSRLENFETSQYRSNVFHCDVGKDRVCTKYLLNDFWKLDNSLNHDLDEILDRRWEKFQIIKTPKINFNSLSLPEISSKNFTFEVLVKVKTNGFIFLCDGSSPPQNNCYWISLAGWKGRESVIRKCEVGTIPKYEGLRPQGKCMVKRAINYLTFSNQSSTNEWNLFKISINNFTLNVECNNQNILNYKDLEQSISINHVLIASLMDSPGQWKINDQSKTHKTGEPYLVHKFQHKKIKFNFSVRRINAFDSFFVYLCEDDNIFGGLCYKVIFNDNGRNSICKIIEKVSFNECVQTDEVYWKGFGKVTNWYHLKFLRNRDVFSFYREDEKVVEFRDENFSVNYVFIGSEKMVFWKIHSYGVISTKQSGETSLPLFHAKKNDNVCVAIFVQKKSNCNLTLSLSENRTKTFINLSLSEENIWKEVQLKTNIGKDAFLFLNISLLTNKTGYQGFISDIRDCNENERILELNTTGLNREIPICSSIKFPEIRSKGKKGLVKNATLIVKSSNQVDFIWAPDLHDKFYTLNYSPLKYIGCDEKINPIEVSKLLFVPTNFGSLLNARISNLIPFVIYNFSLQDDSENIIIKETINMLPKENIENDELPKVQYAQDEFKFEVTLTLRDCKMIRGPLFYELTLIGMDSWNKNPKVEPILNTVNLGVTTHTFYVLGSSSYNVSMLYSRSEEFLKVVRQDIILHTFPTAPLPVTNVTVYSKTNSSISIKWKEPFPPTGELECYFIRYSSRNYPEMEIMVNRNSNCILWPEYICVKIENLSFYEKYTIDVKAKNINLTSLSEVEESIFAITKEDPPQPPKSFNTSLIDFLMIVKWEYPDVTNGPLKSFIITVQEEEFIFPIKEEIRFYTATVDLSNFSASILNIALKVSNFAGVSKPLITTLSTPPKTPKISSNGTFQIVDNVVVLNPLILEDLDGFSEIFLFVPNHPYDPIKFTCNKLSSAEIYLHTKLSYTKFKNDDQKLNISLKDRVLSGQYLKAIVIIVRNSFEGRFKCASHKLFLRWEQSAYIWLAILIMVVMVLIITASGFIFYRCYYNDEEDYPMRFSVWRLCN